MTRHPLPLDGRQVFRCFVGDWVFWLEFIEPSEVFVCIEQSFRLLFDGYALEMPYGDVESLGKAVILAGRTVKTSTALADGTLEVIFEDGPILQVSPHDYYESWRIEGPQGFFAVCTPGGDIGMSEGQDR